MVGKVPNWKLCQQAFVATNFGGLVIAFVLRVLQDEVGLDKARSGQASQCPCSKMYPRAACRLGFEQNTPPFQRIAELITANTYPEKEDGTEHRDDE